MEAIVSALAKADIANLLIVAGVLFLFLAVVGGISGKVQVGRYGRIAASALGVAFVILGGAVHLNPASLPAPPAPPSAPTAEPRYDVSGTWPNTKDFGVMRLVHYEDGHVTGEYGDDEGRFFQARIKGMVLDGYWVEKKSKERCNSSKDGSHYWGRVRMQFSADAKSLKGSWGYCNNHPTNTWNGSR